MLRVTKIDLLRKLLLCEYRAYSLIAEDSLVIFNPETGSLSISTKSLSHWVFNRCYGSESKNEDFKGYNICNYKKDVNFDDRLFLLGEPQLLKTKKTEINIRPLFPPDCKKVYELLKDVYPNEDFDFLNKISSGLFSRKGSHYVFNVYGQGDKKIHGLSAMYIDKQLNLAWLGWTIVGEENRGRGFQRQMVNFRVRLAQELLIPTVTCEVTPESSSCENLLSMGFEEFYRVRYKI